MKELIKAYGPYDNSADKRKRMVLYYSDMSTSTISYARFRYMQLHGEIPKGFEVDHVDDDKTNDTDDNYQLLTKAENIKKSSYTPLYTDFCPECGDLFTRPRNKIRKGRIPYCTKRCAGKANATKRA